jgi:hypothetical protein
MGQGPGTIRLRRPNNPQRRYELQCSSDFPRVAGVLNQLHNDEARNRREVRQAGEPLQRRRVPALNINQHVGVHEVHRLWLRPSLRLLPQGAGVCRGVHDLRPRTDESFALPVGEQFRTGARGEAPPSCQESQGILREREPEVGGFAGEVAFQFGWQVQHKTHGCPRLSPL